MIWCDDLTLSCFILIKWCRNHQSQMEFHQQKAKEMSSNDVQIVEPQKPHCGEAVLRAPRYIFVCFFLSPQNSRWIISDHFSDNGFWFLNGYDLQSLCNACGIRSRKKRRAILGLKPEEKRSRKINNGRSMTSSSSSSSSSESRFGRSGSPLHRRLIALGREVMMQRSTVDKKLQRGMKKLGEEEQAAVLLMALSYGSVYA